MHGQGCNYNLYAWTRLFKREMHEEENELEEWIIVVVKKSSELNSMTSCRGFLKK